MESSLSDRFLSKCEYVTYLPICFKSIIIQVQLHYDLHIFFIQVFHFYFILGLQDLLCLWLHDVGSGDPLHCDSLRYYRLYVFPAERRGLQVVSVALFA